MRTLTLWAQNDFLLNLCIWILIHLSIGFWSSRIPVTWFNPDSSLYRMRKWEGGGTVYQRLFRVRSWKRFLPFGGHLYPNTFSLQSLQAFDIPYLERWLKESCRSEFCHWMLILPGFFFFFWNNVQMAWWMVIYAVVNNFFPIVVQRYNRPRVRNLLSNLKRSPRQSLNLPHERILSPQHE